MAENVCDRMSKVKVATEEQWRKAHDGHEVAPFHEDKPESCIKGLECKTCKAKWINHAGPNLHNDTPKPGEIRPVSGGHGLMYVREYDWIRDAAEMLGHGFKKGAPGHWFYTERLGKPVGKEVVLKEREEAQVRNVGCNNLDCWCRQFD